MWTFLTHYTHILQCLARSPDIRARDIAYQVGITERAVCRLLADLVEAGYLERERRGRRNRYRIRNELPLRHPLEASRSVGTLLACFNDDNLFT